ncbi:hypothetical protein M514_05181 [Trichuris suis]|uniref:Uncharacterized protein n=1 Tax=Trichuris suis TaxID=68888 RepID=A0A085M9L8_9BILA|nr:hypothetical protein M513_05181 [Trichuris suis]KFD62781.1 hypothetical protein M514_05181 [Trichuris suis]
MPQRRGLGRSPEKKPEQTEKQRKQPKYEKMMTDAIKGSAVVERSSQCSRNLGLKILCRESRFSLRKIKEEFYIRYNESFNRNKGVKDGKSWATLINRSGCRALAP